MKTAKEVLEAKLRQLYEDDATFFLYGDELLAALREAGYCVVPREPTERMSIRGDQEICALRDDTEAAQACAAWHAMVAEAEGAG